MVIWSGLFLINPIPWKKWKTRGRYIATAQLMGHSSGAYVLSANFSGTFLASGGYDGVRIWDLNTHQPLEVPPQAAPRGPVSCLRWITGTFDMCDTLSIGTLHGWLILWQQNLKTGAFKEVFASPVCPREITDVNFDQSSDQGSLKICLTARGGIVQAWYLPSAKEEDLPDSSLASSNYEPRNIFSVKISLDCPRSVGFVETNGVEGCVQVLDRSGNLHCLDSNGHTTNTKSLGHTVGHAEASSLKRLYIVDSGSEYKLYSLDNALDFIQSFPTKTEGKHFPRQVTFGERGQIIVGGSKEGVIHVFDIKSGAPLDVLHHPAEKGVYAVAVSAHSIITAHLSNIIKTYLQGNRHFVAAASVEEGSALSIWSYEAPSPPKRRVLRRLTFRALLLRIMATSLFLCLSFLGIDYHYLRQDSMLSKCRNSISHLMVISMVFPDVLPVLQSVAYASKFESWFGTESILQHQAQPRETCAPSMATTCQVSLLKLQDELDEWKWSSWKSHEAANILHEESRWLREYLDKTQLLLEARLQETRSPGHRSEDSRAIANNISPISLEPGSCPN